MLPGLLFCLALTLSDVNAQTLVNSIAGSDVKLICDLQMADPPQVSWVDFVYNLGRDPTHIYDSKNFPDRAIEGDHPNRANMVVNDDMSLTIKNVRFDVDDGEYFCRSRGADGNITEQYFLLGITALPECSGSAQTINGVETVKLSCQTHFSGSMIPKIRWYRGDKMIESSLSSDFGVVKEDVTPIGLTQGHQCDQYICRMTIGQAVRTCNMKFNIEVADGEVVPEPVKKMEHLVDVLENSGNLNLSSLATKADLFKVRDQLIEIMKQGVNKLDRKIGNQGRPVQSQNHQARRKQPRHRN